MAVAKRTEKLLKELRNLPDNKRCFNCESLGTSYYVPQLSVFVCTQCSGVHMQCGHRVKSVTLADFKPAEVEQMEQGGNEAAAHRYLARYHAGRDVRRPTDKTPQSIKQWICAVFIEQRYYDPAAFVPPQRSSGSDGGGSAAMSRSSSFGLRQDSLRTSRESFDGGGGGGAALSLPPVHDLRDVLGQRAMSLKVAPVVVAPTDQPHPAPPAAPAAAISVLPPPARVSSATPTAAVTATAASPSAPVLAANAPPPAAATPPAAAADGGFDPFTALAQPPPALAAHAPVTGATATPSGWAAFDAPAAAPAAAAPAVPAAAPLPAPAVVPEPPTPPKPATAAQAAANTSSAWTEFSTTQTTAAHGSSGGLAGAPPTTAPGPTTPVSPSCSVTSPSKAAGSKPLPLDLFADFITPVPATAGPGAAAGPAVPGSSAALLHQGRAAVYSPVQQQQYWQQQHTPAALVGQAGMHGAYPGAQQQQWQQPWHQHTPPPPPQQQQAWQAVQPQPWQQQQQQPQPWQQQQQWHVQQQQQQYYQQQPHWQQQQHHGLGAHGPPLASLRAAAEPAAVQSPAPGPDALWTAHAAGGGAPAAGWPVSPAAAAGAAPGAAAAAHSPWQPSPGAKPAHPQPQFPPASSPRPQSDAFESLVGDFSAALPKHGQQAPPAPPANGGGWAPGNPFI